MKYLLFSTTIINYVFCVKIWSQSFKEISACQDKPVNLMKRACNKIYTPQVVDVFLGANIHLECNFCNINDVSQNKQWYFKKRGLPNSTEIQIVRAKGPKITISPTKILNIKNFKLQDSGIYKCRNKNEGGVFTYVIDGFIDSPAILEIGIASRWQEYNLKLIDPLNKMFIKSEDNVFRSLRDKFTFTFRLFLDWEPWGHCENFADQKGFRTKLGRCRLHPVSCHDENQKTNASNQKCSLIENNIKNYYLVDNYDVSCRSLTLEEHFPKLSKIVRKIPNFEITENCDMSPVNDYKFKDVKHIGENGHITLICPEIDIMESTVEWFKNDMHLDSSFRHNMANSKEEPHITIDMYNTLYILHATKNEEAIYSCTVDGTNMEKFDIRVVSKSKLLNREFIKYSIYLGFVLSVSLTCYCAGMCVAWHQRSSFADPLNLKSKRNCDCYKTETLLPQ